MDNKIEEVIRKHLEYCYDEGKFSTSPNYHWAKETIIEYALDRICPLFEPKSIGNTLEKIKETLRANVRTKPSIEGKDIVSVFWDDDKIAKEICQLFEPKSYPTDAEITKETGYRFGQPSSEPGESRLLTKEEIEGIIGKHTWEDYKTWLDSVVKEIVKAQLAKDMEWEDKQGFIKEAEIKCLREDLDKTIEVMKGLLTPTECQARVELFRRLLKAAKAGECPDPDCELCKEKWNTIEEAEKCLQEWTSSQKQEGVK